MVKSEFLEILRDTLTGELSSEKIAEHIKYYEEYIGEKIQSGLTEEDVMRELGEPRLIAKTIIDTFKVSKEYQYDRASDRTQSRWNENSYDEYEEELGNKNRRDNYTRNGYEGTNDYNLKDMLGIHHQNWYQKLIAVFVIVLFFIIIITVGALAIRLFFVFGLPILLVYMAYKLLTSSFHSRK